MTLNTHHIELKLFEDSCVVGKSVRGKVSLNLPETSEVWRVRIVFLGKEVARDGLSQEHVIVKHLQLLREFNKQSMEPIEYGLNFTLQIPEGLPSSWCLAQWHNKRTEIAYSVSAEAISHRNHVVCEDTRPLRVRAEVAKLLPKDYVLVLPHTFAVQTNLVFPRGNILLGLQSGSDVVMTGGTLSVDIDGHNPSQVDVKTFAIRLMETVVQSPAPGIRQKRQRILASTKVTVAPDDPHWKAGSQTAGQPLKATLSIPHNALCDSYSGTVVSVQHDILVIAETAVERTTNPRLTSPVHLAIGYAEGRVPGSTLVVSESGEWEELTENSNSN